ncbi:helix-turn-helix domain-containing protein [Photobacterium damselae]|uniref:helix-turn-helix domain-containing protein n=1 Tax=Photobacterium damselae TaxID=38293 RepID=UPI0040680723
MEAIFHSDFTSKLQWRLCEPQLPNLISIEQVDDIQYCSIDYYMFNYMGNNINYFTFFTVNNQINIINDKRNLILIYPYTEQYVSNNDNEEHMIYNELYFSHDDKICFKKRDVIFFKAIVIPRVILNEKIDQKLYLYDFHYNFLLSEIICTLSSKDIEFSNKIDMIIKSLLLDFDNKVVMKESLYTKVTDIVKKYIRDEELSIGFVAKELHVSVSLLQKELSKLGVSYSYILKKCRLSLLKKHLLLEYSQPLKKICFLCGYNSLSNASKQFKDEFGMSLRDYQKKYNKFSS